MRFFHRWLGSTLGIACAGLIPVTGCTGGAATSSPGTQTTLSFSLGSSSVVVPQDGTPATVALNVTGPSGAETLSVTNMPAGISVQFTQASSTSLSGTLSFTSTATVIAGNYAPNLTVTVGSQSASQGFTLVSAVVAKVARTPDTSLGVKGYLQQFMSTSFQVSSSTNDFFGYGPTTGAIEATLNALQPQHVRVQAISAAVPMVSDTNTPSDWDFDALDETVEPLLETGDQSPEIQIAVAPAWMCLPNGNFDITHHLHDFATYAANLVRYYNTGGFTWGGRSFEPISTRPITWWGIFNEPNLNGLTAGQYVTLYNTVVPAMLAVDPTLKFSAMEFSGYGLGTIGAGDPELYLPIFFAPANAGGADVPVNSLSAHLYGTCDQLTTDAAVFAAVPQFVSSIQYFYEELATRPDLAGVPVWVTENNVNADYPLPNGTSNCNSGRAFIADPRGTDAFFAAWRPYVFSQLGKAGNQALYHWTYNGDTQYGEVDDNGNPYLSYWVDRTLATIFPYPAGGPGAQILTLAATNNSSVESLAVQNPNGTLTVMIVDYAAQSSTDDNGGGAARSVVVDLSSWNNFAAASLVTIDANTNTATGPSGVGVTPATRMTITLPGYGVAFLTLTP